MARTPEEVVADYQAEYAAIDPSSSVHYGPVTDLVIRPNSRFISEVEERQDRTDRLASADFTSVTTDEELERMAGAVGAGAPQGASATTSQAFGTYSRPKAGEVLQIPLGSIIGSLDGTLLYQTTAAAQIDGNYPDVYLNPSKRTYEVLVPIRSVASGSRYNLPPFRIRKTISSITGIDFTENRNRLVDGRDVGTSEDLVAHAQASLQGQELGSIGGLEDAVKNAFPGNIPTVSVITSSDSSLFRRPITKPGIDIYYSGEVLGEIETTYTAIGGEITIPFPNKPLVEVIQFLVNGSAVSYELIVDTDLATSGSVMDGTYILLATSLTPGDSVFMRYSYDTLAAAVDLSFAGSNSLFDVDTISRKIFQKSPLISLVAKAASNSNPFSLRTDLESAILEFFETNEHAAIYIPSVFEDFLQDRVIGLASRPSVSIFQLEERALLNIEPIELRRNEECKVDLDLIDMNIQ